MRAHLQQSVKYIGYWAGSVSLLSKFKYESLRYSAAEHIAFPRIGGIV